MRKMLSTLTISTLLAFNTTAASAAFNFPSTNWFNLAPQQATQQNVVDQEAMVLIEQLIDSVPQLAGKALGESFSQRLGSLSQPSSSEVFSFQLAEGLNVALSDIKLSPISASIIFDFDNYELIPASDNGPAIHVSGPVSGTFSYNVLTQKISLNLDSIGNAPIVYSGGQLDGTEVEFDNLAITVNTSNFIPFWEEQIKVEGHAYINGVLIPVEELVKLFKMIQG